MGYRATGSTPALPAGQRTPRFVSAASTAAGKAAVRLTTGLSRAVGALGHLELYALHRLRGELAFLASHDATALPNRSPIEEKSEQTIDTCIRVRKPGALMVDDIDALTYVNHSRGQVVGDQVLARVSQLLRSALGPDDVVLRLGGDQFAAVLAGASPSESYNAVRRILEALRREPITVDGDRAVRIKASVGLRTGLITRIDLVIAEACRIVGEHQRAGRSPRFEVNLSGPSMGDPAVLAALSPPGDAAPPFAA